VLIHHYLPSFIVKFGEEAILKMVEHWLSNLYGKPFLEFITLPRGTFPIVEKTLQSLLAGFINLNITKKNGEYVKTFSVHRACKPEYHGVEFPYNIQDDRLLIRFTDEFIDTFPATEEEEERKKAYLMDHVADAKVVMGKVETNKLPPTDYLLLTQLHNMHLTDVKLLFPEKFDEITEKIVKWMVKDSANLQEAQKINEKPISKLCMRCELALRFPSWLALKFFGKKPRTVPIESLLGLRKTVEVILHTYLPNEREPLEVFEATEKFIHEVAGRVTAIERIKAMGEEPQVKMDLHHLVKIASLTLGLGFKLKCNIIKKSEGLWELKVKDCFICQDAKSNRPICHAISGTLTGALSVAFKEKLLCEEISCKAMDDKECVFIIKRL